MSRWTKWRSGNVSLLQWDTRWKYMSHPVCPLWRGKGAKLSAKLCSAQIMITEAYWPAVQKVFGEVHKSNCPHVRGHWRRNESVGVLCNFHCVFKKSHHIKWTLPNKRRISLHWTNWILSCLLYLIGAFLWKGWQCNKQTELCKGMLYCWFFRLLLVNRWKMSKLNVYIVTKENKIPSSCITLKWYVPF